MGLEDEAIEFMNSERSPAKLFKAALAEYMLPTLEYVKDNVHDTKERGHALQSLAEFGFWINHAVDTHGIKELVTPVEWQD